VTLLQNPYFIVPLIAWAIAQASKVIIDSVVLHRLSVHRLATAGGMPSSHTALVVSLTTIIGRLQGVGSALFAVCLIFSTVVMYDATGVRRAAGQQAIIRQRLAYLSPDRDHAGPDGHRVVLFIVDRRTGADFRRHFLQRQRQDAGSL